jgi:hypothetical protein
MKAQQLLTGTFTTKDGYLVWRQAWKLVYARTQPGHPHDQTRGRRIAPAIPLLAGMTNQSRGCDHAPVDRRGSQAPGARMPPSSAEARTEQWSSEPSLDWQPSPRCFLRGARWSKEEAQRQYLAAKAGVRLTNCGNGKAAVSPCGGFSLKVLWITFRCRWRHLPAGRLNLPPSF